MTDPSGLEQVRNAEGSDRPLPPDDLTLRLERIVRADPTLMAILRAIQDLPQARLVAGCLSQSVWNVLTARPQGYGIRDYEVATFDAADLSWEAEDRVSATLAARLPALASRLEVRNQARAHLWHEDRFGTPCAPLRSTEEAIDRSVGTTHMVGVRLTPDDALDVHAPGLADIFALRVRPNRDRDGWASYTARAYRMQALWPELSIEPW